MLAASAPITSYAGGMPRNNVIAFPGVRADLDPATLIISAAIRNSSGIYRQIGINNQLTIAELSHVLQVAFDTEPSTPTAADLPRAVLVDDMQVDDDAQIGEVFPDTDMSGVWHWGPHHAELFVSDSIPRDGATPDALCVGGAGMLTGTLSGTLDDLAYADLDAAPDIAEINANLTGERTIRSVLDSTRTEVRDLISRSGIFDFIPLLQALDLRRESDIAPELAHECAELPLEDASDQAGRDAAFINMLCFAALTDENHRAEITEYAMAALGWVEDDGSPIRQQAIDALCPHTLQKLTDLGCIGPEPAAAVDRVAMLREVFRNPELDSPSAAATR